MKKIMFNDRYGLTQAETSENSVDDSEEQGAGGGNGNTPGGELEG